MILITFLCTGWKKWSLNLSANTSETFENRKVYIPVLWQHVHWLLCPFQICDYINIFYFSDFSYTPGLTAIIFNPSNISKFDILVTKSEDHQLAKRVLQVVSIHVLLCYCHSCHVLESYSIIKQNLASPVEVVSKLDN